jgi:uncharacterized membrane protein YhhN
MTMLSTRLKMFLAVAVLHLFAQLFAIELLHLITKPLLMPLLLWFFIDVAGEAKRSINYRRMLFALIFSWLGDTMIMFSDLSEVYFMAGVFCFLITQTLYIFIFLSFIRKRHITKPFLMLMVTLFVSYGILLLNFLMPAMGNLALPIIIYASALTLMGITASLTRFALPSADYYLLLSGSVLFIFSDSILAYNKFLIPFAYASFLTMLTYLLAQCLIVVIIKRNIR